MQITIPLDEKASHPVAKLAWFKNCQAMIDTGALFPVWTAPIFQLLSLGAVLEEKNIPFSGFGGQTYGDLYKVDFKLGNLIYKDMPVIATRMDNLNCHMILSATMFDQMIYTIDTRNHFLSIDTCDNQLIRHLKIQRTPERISVYLAGTYQSEKDYAGNNAGR